jgi:hypothetical protein
MDKIPLFLPAFLWLRPGKTLPQSARKFCEAGPPFLQYASPQMIFGRYAGLLPKAARQTVRIEKGSPLPHPGAGRRPGCQTTRIGLHLSGGNAFGTKAIDFIFVVAQIAFSHPEQPGLIVNLLEPGRTFRGIPSEMWALKIIFPSLAWILQNLQTRLITRVFFHP